MAQFIPILGNLSGKLAGLVFSRNRYGQYCRQYRRPVNPDTQAQRDFRAKFGAAAQTWHSLGDEAKAHWKSYAETIFNPRHGISSGQFTGMNAFMSLYSMASLCNDYSVNPTLYADMVPVGSPTFDVVDLPGETPPDAPVSASVKTDNPLVNSPLVVDECSYFVDTSLIVHFKFDGLLGATFPGGNITDANDNILSFMVFVSSGKKQRHNYTANSEIHCMHKVGKPNFVDASMATSYGFEFGASDLRYKVKSLPAEGEVVRVSLYGVTDGGQVTCLCSTEADVLPLP